MLEDFKIIVCLVPKLMGLSLQLIGSLYAKWLRDRLIDTGAITLLEQFYLNKMYTETRSRSKRRLGGSPQTQGLIALFFEYKLLNLVLNRLFVAHKRF